MFPVPFNWYDFGCLRVPSASEDATLVALGDDLSADVGKEMYLPVRPHLFLNRPVNSNSYFMFVVARWRNNVERRDQVGPAFQMLKHMGNTLYEWLSALDKCVTVKCVREIDLDIPTATLPNEVFERLRRVFRLLVSRMNNLNAKKGLPFLTTGQPDVVDLHPNFYTKHRFDNVLQQKKFMSRKRKEMTPDHLTEFDRSLGLLTGFCAPVQFF